MFYPAFELLIRKYEMYDACNNRLKDNYEMFFCLFPVAFMIAVTAINTQII